MTWHYLPVRCIANKGDPLYEDGYIVLIEVHVDKEGRMHSWVPIKDPPVVMGNDITDLEGSLIQMLYDCRRWEVVNEEDLVTGMKLKRRDSDDG